MRSLRAEGERDIQGASLRGVHPTGQEDRKKRLRVVAGKSQI